MNQKKVYSWSKWAILVALVVALYNGWILLPGFYKDSHFRFEAPKRHNIMRNDSALTIYLRNDVQIRIFARCHHYPFQNHSELLGDKCWIRIFLVGSKLKFENHTEFHVKDISWWKKPSQIGTSIMVIESDHEWAEVRFKSNRHPSKIQLQIPTLTIGDEKIDVPIVIGSYVEKIRFSFGW